MTDFFEAVHQRRSIHRFRATPIPQALLTRILEAAARAPSAGNAQAYRIVVVTHPERRQRVARAAGHHKGVAEAPVILVFCADPARSMAMWGAKGEQLLCVQDTTVACAYAQLAAAALGLASVWLGAVIEPEAIREALGLTEDVWPLIVLPLGYAAEAPPPRPRRPLSELVREDFFERGKNF
jgi:nitroreductase